MVPQIETEVAGMQQCLSHLPFSDDEVFGPLPLGTALILATFVGYKVERRVASAVDTVGALFPSFVMTLVVGAAFLNRVRTNPRVQAFLSELVPAVVGMLAAAGVSLAKSRLDSTVSFGVGTTAFLLMLRAKLNPAVIIVGCGALQFAVAHYIF